MPQANLDEKPRFDRPTGLKTDIDLHLVHHDGIIITGKLGHKSGKHLPQPAN